MALPQARGVVSAIASTRWTDRNRDRLACGFSVDRNTNHLSDACFTGSIENVWKLAGQRFVGQMRMRIDQPHQIPITKRKSVSNGRKLERKNRAYRYDPKRRRDLVPAYHSHGPLDLV